MSNKYEPTSSGYKEVDAENKDKAAITEAVTPEKKVSGTKADSPADKKTKKSKKEKKAKAGKDTGDAYSLTEGGRKKSYPKNVGAEGGASGEKLALETNRTIPYPELGGHTVAQLAGMETHKRKSILASHDNEFVTKYMK